MTKLSKRISGINEAGGDGWDLYVRARDMAAAGEPVIQLTIGEHDIRTDPAILDAMHRAAKAGNTGYTFGPGLPPLRAAIAERIAARTGTPTGPENILVVTGGQAGLFAALTLACDPGDVALHIDPYYATYPGTIRSTSVIPRAVIAHPEDGFEPRAEAVEAAADGARALLLNSPNNPTGAVYSEATLTALGEVARARDLWIISDEVYDSQVWEGRHLSPRALPDLTDRTLAVGSMSKSHAMTGSRVGWVCGPAEAIEAMTHLATCTTYGLPGFIQEAALHALKAGDDFEAGIAEPFARRRRIALDLLSRQQAVAAAPPRGGMYVMIDIRPTGLSGTAFAEALLDEERIAVMPGESFGTGASGHIRIAMTVADAAFADAMTRLLAFAARRAAAPAT